MVDASDRPNKFMNCSRDQSYARANNDQKSKQWMDRSHEPKRIFGCQRCATPPGYSGKFVINAPQESIECKLRRLFKLCGGIGWSTGTMECGMMIADCDLACVVLDGSLASP